MIVVLKLVTGEEVIGRLSCNTDQEFDALDLYEMFDPMWIVPTENGAMKLRDALMLADNISLIFNPGDVITCYKPIQSLVQYYERAMEYSQKYTRDNINTQIEQSVLDMNDMIEEERQYEVKAAEIFRRMTGSKLH